MRHIVGLEPWSANGPGWSNKGVTIQWRDNVSGKLTEEARYYQSRTEPVLSARAAELCEFMRPLYDALVAEILKSEKKPRIDHVRFMRAPCYLCGYNGQGYFSPTRHACARLFHEQEEEEAKP